MERAQYLTRKLREYDYKLFCKRMEGKLCVFRESKRVESFWFDEDTVIHSVRSAPYLIMALTDNWKVHGTPVDWGLEPIMARLKENDLWNRDIVSDIEKQSEKFEKQAERKLKNDTEAFLHDFRGSFKKTFNDVNTANMSKIDLRRKKEK